MAYTTVKRIFGQAAGLDGNWDEIEKKCCYFHPDDVMAVLHQPGVVAVQVVPAKFKLKGGGHKSSLVLIGLRPSNEARSDGQPAQYFRADDEDEFIALMCGHLNEPGGKWKEDVEIDPDKPPIPVVPGPGPV